MALPEPSTISPGKLVLQYITPGGPHQTGVRYTVGSMPTTVTAAVADATDLANALAPLFSSTTSFTGWKLTTLDNNTLAEGSFATGIHGTAATHGKYYSTTATLQGKGTPASIGIGSGLTRMVLFTGDAGDPAPGEKQFVPASGDAWGTFMTYLRTSTKIWADEYGQKCTVFGYVTTQFNAREQKRNGS